MVKVYTHEVSGIQFLGGHTEKEKAEIKEFLGDIRHYYDELDLIIPDDEGDLVVNETDYILKEANGKVYAIEESDFKKLYRENEPCEGLAANDDWKKNRSFSTALDWLKVGGKVRRKDWFTWLSLDQNTGIIVLINNERRGLWQIEQESVMANDWEIYEEE